MNILCSIKSYHIKGLGVLKSYNSLSYRSLILLLNVLRVVSRSKDFTLCGLNVPSIVIFVLGVLISKFFPVSHGCSRAYLGVILIAGSIVRHLSMKSWNTYSVSPLFSNTFLIECSQSGMPVLMLLLFERINS